jgi:hypothetical protein
MWCKTCQINSLKQSYTNWTSGNEKIDEFIHGKQMKINNYDDVIVEWIPYNQFNIIKEIGKDDSFTYFAIWINGPLRYESYKMRYERTSNNKVILKGLYNSQKVTNEFLNKV